MPVSFLENVSRMFYLILLNKFLIQNYDDSPIVFKNKSEKGKAKSISFPSVFNQSSTSLQDLVRNKAFDTNVGKQLSKWIKAITFTIFT